MTDPERRETPSTPMDAPRGRGRTGRAALWTLGFQTAIVIVVFVPWLNPDWLFDSWVPADFYTNLFVIGVVSIFPLSAFVLLVGISTSKSDNPLGAARGRIVIVGSIVVAIAAALIIAAGYELQKM